MEKSFFFNARETSPDVFDRVYQAEDFAAYFAEFIGNGIYPNPSTGLQVLENDTPDMTTVLSPGAAFINGYGYKNDANIKFSHKVADATLNRKDAIFIRFDKAGRAIGAIKMEGTPGISAVAPAVVRTADYFDLCVGVVNITAGAIKITQSMIEDTRMDNEVCGIVHAVVDQIDTTTLYNQIQNDLKYFKDVSQADFNKWFEDINDKLGTEPATALQVQVDDLKVAVGGVPLENTSKSSPNSVAVTSAKNRINSVTVQGFTTQEGSGDPSPSNVWEISNAGEFNMLEVFDGSNDENWIQAQPSSGNTIRFDFIEALSNHVFNPTKVMLLCNLIIPGMSTSDFGDYEHIKTSSLEHTKNAIIVYIAKSRLSEATVDGFRAFLAKNNMLVAYKSTEDTGKHYTGIEVTQGDDYHCTIIEINDRLHEGDTLETNAESEFNNIKTFDGSENWMASSTSGVYYLVISGLDSTVFPLSNLLPSLPNTKFFSATTPSISANLNSIYVRCPDNANAKTYFSENPITIAYKTLVGETVQRVKRTSFAKKTYVFTGAENITTYPASGGYNLYLVRTQNDWTSEKQYDAICNQYPIGSTAGTYWMRGPASGNIAGTVQIRDDRFSTAEELQANLAALHAAETPVTVEYELTVPEVYADAPVEIENPKGDYTVSGEDGTTIDIYVNTVPTPEEIGALPADGTAESAVKLETPVNIGSAPFDGSQSITLVQMGAVPTSRTVNGKQLNENITIEKSDVGLGKVVNKALAMSLSGTTLTITYS